MLAERSALWCPSNNPRFVDNIGDRDCDGVILDLEASVPDDQQVQARYRMRESIGKVSRGGARVTVRPNHRPWLADLEWAIWPGVEKVIYPQCEYPEEVRRVDEALTRLERERGIRPGAIELYPLIETVRGVANGYEIAAASPRVRFFGGGFLGFDTCRDLVIENVAPEPRTRETVYYLTGECALTARALGIQTTNGVMVETNLSGDVSAGSFYERRAVENKAAGLFGGGSSLHPNGVAPLNKGFTPTPEEVVEGRALVQAFAELDARGEVEGTFNGRILDRWEAARAQKLLDWAEACERTDRRKAGVRARNRGLEQTGGPR